MFFQDKYGVFKSRYLTKISWLIHGFSSRADGDMRKVNNKKNFLKKLNLPLSSIYRARQTHSDKIVVINDQVPIDLLEADGLVMPGKMNIKNSICKGLSVFTADCVPLVFTDIATHTIAVAHAGWKGTYQKIAVKVILTMESLGSRKNDIYVTIGPHIGSCCYDIPTIRAKLFADLKINSSKYISFYNDKWYIDLGECNSKQLLSIGIKETQIENCKLCTACQVKDFFSYRKDASDSFGEMIGVIAVNPKTYANST